MATFLALKRGTAAATSFRKLFSPIRSVSATPSVQRCFNTDATQISAYDDFNRTVDVDRRPDSSVSRRHDNDFEYLYNPSRSLRQMFNMIYQRMNNPLISATCLRGFVARKGWAGKVNGDAFHLRFDMPGLDKENVNISVEQDVLIIRAEAGDSEDDIEESSRRYLSRIRLLPTDAVKMDEMKAEMKNGVLKIVVPKVKEDERKNVFEVEVE